jgi:hypothetical protein
METKQSRLNFSGKGQYQANVAATENHRQGDQLCFPLLRIDSGKSGADAMMVELDKSYPEYGFASHKGYACVART